MKDEKYLSSYLGVAEQLAAISPYVKNRSDLFSVFATKYLKKEKLFIVI